MNYFAFKAFIKRIIKIPTKNKYNIMGKKIRKNIVNLEWWSGVDNVGDGLAPVIFEWMLKEKKIDFNKNVKTKHLMTIGSLIGSSNSNAVVWGSGLMNAENTIKLVFNSLFTKLDIRAVRGPITRKMLIELGYNCPEIYGDPAVLMPFIYNPKVEKKYEVSLICHHLSEISLNNNIHKINIATKNYEKFIDEICSSELVVSSSLHGIILAEVYGVPAIFLNHGIWEQSAKFLDWYYSTNRFNVRMISTLDEISTFIPMPIPNLDEMREKLINCFPYDLWK